MATETNLESEWRPYTWKKQSSRRRNVENTVNDEDSKEPAEQSNKNRPDLRMNVFISKDSTGTLADCVLYEEWGADNNNLYKYIDYTWRSALFKRQVFAFTEKSGKECLVFHSGLQRRGDGEFIYLVLVPNDDKQKTQKWRIASTPTPDWSFKIAVDLLPYVHGEEERLPKRCQFYENPSELLFDTNCAIHVDWVKSIESCKLRIQMEIVNSLLEHDTRQYDEIKAIWSQNQNPLPITGTLQGVEWAIDQLKHRGYTIPDPSELQALFRTSFETSSKIVKANPYFVVPQGFVDSKKCECRLELLLPIFVSIDSNVRTARGTKKITLCFALALQREESFTAYKAMSILTPDMAYTNARLVGLVNSAWLLAAAWPKVYASPLLMQHNPPNQAFMMGFAAPGEMQRGTSAPLQMDDYSGFSRPHTEMRRVRVQQPNQKNVSAPPRFIRPVPPGLMPRQPNVPIVPKQEDVTRRSLFVKNIPSAWDEAEIKKQFQQHGTVNRITMLPNRNKESDKQLCLIEMSSPQEAINAQKRLNDDENEEGLKVQPQRGKSRPLGMTRASSDDDIMAGMGSSSTDWRARRQIHSQPPTATHVTPQPKCTLRIDNLQPQQNASTIRTFLQALEIDEIDIEWINVYHPDNYAFVRFKTALDATAAETKFRNRPKIQYNVRVVKNPPKVTQDDSYWKFNSPSGEKLDMELSRRLDRLAFGQTMYENPHDENNSARITRYDGSLASRFMPDSQSSVPLIRVQITTWKQRRQWTNSRLRNRGGPRSSPLNMMRNTSAPTPLGRVEPAPLQATEMGMPSFTKSDDVNESKEQSRRSLNPHAVAFDPHQTSRHGRLSNEDFEESMPNGARFVPHDDAPQFDVARGSDTWASLADKFGRILGCDINYINEWPNPKGPPEKHLNLIMKELWFVHLPRRVELLEKEGFVGRWADHGDGREAAYTLWSDASHALASFGDADRKTQVSFVLCNAWLGRSQLEQLNNTHLVRIPAPRAREPVDVIVPKYIFHTSQRLVGDGRR